MYFNLNWCEVVVSCLSQFLMLTAVGIAAIRHAQHSLEFDSQTVTPPRNDRPAVQHWFLEAAWSRQHVAEDFKAITLSLRYRIAPRPNTHLLTIL